MAALPQDISHRSFDSRLSDATTIASSYEDAAPQLAKDIGGVPGGDQAKMLRGLMDKRPAIASADSAQKADRACTIALTSGKGGVGKSNIALNLAISLSQRGSSVCLLDANLGLGNIDLLCGLSSYWNLSHVVTGARTLRDVILEGPGEIHVVPGASGLVDVADCRPDAQQAILRQMEELERSHDFLIIDSSTGIHRTVRQFARAADIVLVLTTPEPTSIADAYATVKALCVEDGPLLQILVNHCDSDRQGRKIIARLQQTSRLFLHREVASGGCIPRDQVVANAVSRRLPFLIDAPHSAASKAVEQLAHRMESLAGGTSTRSTFFSRIWRSFLRKAA